jgi:hypothetical protein
MALLADRLRLFFVYRRANFGNYFMRNLVHPVIGSGMFRTLFEDFVFGLTACYEVTIHSNVTAADNFGHSRCPPTAAFYQEETYGYCAKKISPQWYSLKSPDSVRVKAEVITPVAPSKFPVPPSTFQPTAPAITPGAALGAKCPGEIVEKRRT